ncbi:MAG TPA: hypothetical protein VM802_00390 [Chitinophaga sp.]|uniref:hypothetical protein n=1 Tax=Chitinophaga sp. TaxID=1869181 RepID=UPI002BCEDF01|nr:hypothetical protein [Chitinophaga sp.]HVI43287.1 hypothetical protein [Chitinophaga sp.]
MRTVVTLLSLLILTFNLAAQDSANAWKIIPGKSIGHITIGAPSEALRVLGMPDGGDAAMMKAWHYWFGRTRSKTIDSSHMLAVYTAMRTQDTQYVKEIRVNSPRFRTDKGVGPGSLMSEIRKAYPGLKLAKSYLSQNMQHQLDVYDDKELGIAFETANPESNNPVCVMVVVHNPGETAGTNLDFHVGYDLLIPKTQ